jgi:high-affinity iron transporter
MRLKGMSTAMARGRCRSYRIVLVLLSAAFFCLGARKPDGADVSGVVRMPDVCSPGASPAVVYLTPVGAKGTAALSPMSGSEAAAGESGLADLALVNQRGLQFVPRVQAIALGRTVRFTNQDSETHNVHVVSPGDSVNQAMAPGQPLDFTPTHAGVMKLTCDIHHHMRGYVIVSPSPWFQICDRDGRFRLAGVPAGHYRLTVWHEMGEPLGTEFEVTDAKPIELPPLVLTLPKGAVGRTTSNSSRGDAPVRLWADVVDRISVTLAESRDAAIHSADTKKALRLADDAYWVEFEASDLETAVQRYLGFSRKGELERQFRAIRTLVREIGAKKQRDASELTRSCDLLMVALVAVTKELNDKGVTDRSKIDAISVAATDVDYPSDPSAGGDPQQLLQALKRGFRRVELVAETDGAIEAASELTTVYMTDFEPLERYFLGRRPQDVRPFEIQFNQLRGDLSAGLKGDALSARLDLLREAVERLVARLESQPAGRFGSAFVASFITIVREGVEVILIVAMLLALVGKATSAALLRGPGESGGAALAKGSSPEQDLAGALGELRSRSVRAIWWGIGAAALASAVTAVALNVLIASAAGAARETLEGAVMLVAAAVLFYVSYWLVSRFEAKRWTDYLAQRTRRGITLGGQGTLALTAFLAVYREGAETSLLYQALLGSEGRTRLGLLGLAAGIVVGAVVLALVATVIRATSVRLPIQLFFKVSGLFLFVLAIVFAGNGVFELQNAGVLITTNLAWMGRGLPWAGVFPSLQVLSVQGLLLFGAVAAWLVVPRSVLGTSAGKPPGIKLVAKRG